MINIKNYLESGVIENYCLGLASPKEVERMFELGQQHPEIRSHVDECQKAMEAYVKSFETKIPLSCKESILNSIIDAIQSDSIELTARKKFSDFIDISNSANFSKLEELIKDIHPPADFESFHVHTLFSKGDQELNLVWVKDIVPMEEHPHLDESFLVFEGTVDCNIDGVITQMARGDFMRIPPESHHEVVITSPTPAKAIQSRITIH